MVIVTGLVLPSVAATSAPELDNSTMRWRQRPPEPPPLRRRYHPSLWRGFSFDLDLTRLLECLGKCLHRLHLLCVFERLERIAVTFSVHGDGLRTTTGRSGGTFLPIFNFDSGEHSKCWAKWLRPQLGPTLSLK